MSPYRTSIYVVRTDERAGEAVESRRERRAHVLVIIIMWHHVASCGITIVIVIESDAPTFSAKEGRRTNRTEQQLLLLLPSDGGDGPGSRS